MFCAIQHEYYPLNVFELEFSKIEYNALLCELEGQ